VIVGAGAPDTGPARSDTPVRIGAQHATSSKALQRVDSPEIVILDGRNAE